MDAELEGYYKLELRKLGYRRVHGVEEDALIVMVMSEDKRADGVVYRSVLARLTQEPTEPPSALKERLIA